MSARQPSIKSRVTQASARKGGTHASLRTCTSRLIYGSMGVCIYTAQLRTGSRARSGQTLIVQQSEAVLISYW